MSTVFPTNLDSFTTKLDGVSDVLAVDTNNIQDSIVALQSKIGVDNSSVVTSIDYKIRNLPVLGVNQTWQPVTRNSGEWYQNTTTRPIMVFARWGTYFGDVNFYVNSQSPDYSGAVQIPFGDGDSDAGSFGVIVVPVNHYYTCDNWGVARELR
jgi:hypothetical protein